MPFSRWRDASGSDRDGRAPQDNLEQAKSTHNAVQLLSGKKEKSPISRTFNAGLKSIGGRSLSFDIPCLPFARSRHSVFA
jgi:hypothetical protein